MAGFQCLQAVSPMRPICTIAASLGWQCHNSAKHASQQGSRFGLPKIYACLQFELWVCGRMALEKNDIFLKIAVDSFEPSDL